MTIKEAIAAAIEEWRSGDDPSDDSTLADYVRQLVDEAIEDLLPDAE